MIERALKEPNSRPVVRLLTRADVGQVWTVHQQSFPGHFLTNIGAGFVRRFYAEFAGDPPGYGVVAEQGGRILGFAVASSDSRALYRRFYRRNFLPLAAIVASRLLFSFSLWRQVFNRGTEILRALGAALNRQRVGEGRGCSPTRPQSARLLSVAVLPEMRGRSVADELVETLCRLLADDGLSDLGLSVFASNSRAVRFYEKTGWESQPSADREVLRYHRSLDSASQE